jgi:uncharacterized membrane protein (UPF0127 family)
MGRLAVLTLLLLVASGCGTPRSAAGLLVIPVEIGDHSVKVELAETSGEQARGLMYRRDMAWNKGMLFVYPSERVLSFWMKNTFIPLAIAFLDGEGRIVHIAHMKPQDPTSHSSIHPARYALEMNDGWFEKAGVKAGDRALFELPSP